jgi:hypothetical protein
VMHCSLPMITTIKESSMPINRLPFYNKIPDTETQIDL